MSKILGISAYYHDSAAALLIDGDIISAAQEERFTRKKHDPDFPTEAINYCLENSNITLNEIDAVVFYDKPFLKFERLLETYIAKSPLGLKSFIKSMPFWLKEKLFLKRVLIEELKKISPEFDASKIFFSEHHLSHAASAFFPSPFEEAIVLTIDGVGEWTTTSLIHGSGNKLKIIKEIHFPHSLGLLYSAFTYYLGFKVNGGEYKVMGLAPYGMPIYKDIILDNLVILGEDGSFRLNHKFFSYAVGLKMTNKKFERLFNERRRNPDEEDLKQFHMDIAASIQVVTEEIVLKIAKSLRDEFDIPNLCLAGGVALNCVINGKILRSGLYDNVWVQPASGDAGGALGAALAFWHLEQNKPRHINKDDAMKGSYLGPKFTQEDIEKELNEVGAVFESLPEEKMLSFVAKKLAEGNSVGWIQGRMEFGPRALGARSILADPRSPSIQKSLNLKTKYRESFRPFAPSILRENLNEWFEANYDSPYMLFVDQVKKDKCFDLSEDDKNLFGLDKLKVPRSSIPAVTHIDYSARIQTVHKNTNYLYHSLINEFNKLTGCPVLVNTSFNLRGEAIVNSPKDAYRCFMSNNLDLLVVGNSILKKDEQFKTSSINEVIRKQNLLNKTTQENFYTYGEKNDVANLVEKFYNLNPFPNYNNFENIFDLNRNILHNPFLNGLKDNLGFNKRIIEVGSGTSQLSLALANGTNSEIYAFDATYESLKLGQKFALDNNINNCTFVHGDILANPFKDKSFDVVWCSGVLHHTGQAEESFKVISKWVKQDGIIIIGLYNFYGRMRTLFRKWLYKLFLKARFIKKLIYILDPVLRQDISEAKKNAWFQDQYEHPVESLHTIGQVIKWFSHENIEFIDSIPSASLDNKGYLELFTRKNKGSALSRFISQINMLFTTLGKEGGLFIVIGRKK